MTLILGKEDNYTELTKEGNFKLHEVIDKTDRYQPSLQQLVNAIMLAEKLELLRIFTGSINVNSWWRSVWLNKNLPKPGSANSYHLQGIAADIRFNFKPWTRYSLTKVLQSIGFTNVNFYWNSDRTSWVWLHVDIGKTWNGEEFYYRDLDAITQKVIEVKW